MNSTVVSALNNKNDLEIIFTKYGVATKSNLNIGKGNIINGVAIKVF